MSLALTILLSLLSAGLMAGRVYEILNLTDANTGFLLVNGIVFNPYVLLIFTVIAVCCGILVFGSVNTAESYYSKASRYTAALAGLAFTAAGVVSISTDKVSMFYIAGSIALLIIAVAGLGKNKSDYAAIALVLIFAAGLCMDVIAFDVSTIYKIEFIQKALAYISIIAFMLFVLKNVYMPSKYSRMMLYVLGMLSFAFCFAMSLADIICYIIQTGAFGIQLVNDIAFVFFGLYAFDNAISAMPTKKELKAYRAEVNGQSGRNKEKSTAAEENPVQEEAETVTEEASEKTADALVNTEFQTDAASEDDKALQDNLEEVFEALALEKAEKSEEDIQEVIAAEEFDIPQQADDKTDNQQDIASDYDMLKALFGEVAAENEPEEALEPKVRSFKKVVAPKHDDTAPQYDMLKSMFKGEDTSEYHVDMQETSNEEKGQKTQQAKKKFSLFGGEKTEKTAKEKTVKKVEEQPKTETKVKFASSEAKTSKGKDTTKKIVYKKPK